MFPQEPFNGSDVPKMLRDDVHSRNGNSVSLVQVRNQGHDVVRIQHSVTDKILRCGEIEFRANVFQDLFNGSHFRLSPSDHDSVNQRLRPESIVAVFRDCVRIAVHHPQNNPFAAAGQAEKLPHQTGTDPLVAGDVIDVPITQVRGEARAFEQEHAAYGFSAADQDYVPARDGFVDLVLTGKLVGIGVEEPVEKGGDRCDVGGPGERRVRLGLPNFFGSCHADHTDQAVVIGKAALAIDCGDGLQVHGLPDEIGGEHAVARQFLCEGPEQGGECSEIRGGMIDAMESAIAEQDQERALAFQAGEGPAGDPVVDSFRCGEPVRHPSRAGAPNAFEGCQQVRSAQYKLNRVQAHLYGSSVAVSALRSVLPFGFTGSEAIWVQTDGNMYFGSSGSNAFRIAPAFSSRSPSKNSTICDFAWSPY